MLRRYSLAVTVLALVAVAALFGKRSDANALAAAGQVLVAKAKAGLPDHSPVAGPIAALKPSDQFPLEERVRARITNDKLVEGSEIAVAAGARPGEVRLRGLAATLSAKTRALQLALETVGVEAVTADELGVR